MRHAVVRPRRYLRAAYDNQQELAWEKLLRAASARIKVRAAANLRAGGGVRIINMPIYRRAAKAFLA